MTTTPSNERKEELRHVLPLQSTRQNGAKDFAGLDRSSFARLFRANRLRTRVVLTRNESRRSTGDLHARLRQQVPNPRNASNSRMSLLTSLKESSNSGRTSTCILRRRTHAVRKVVSTRSNVGTRTSTFAMASWYSLLASLEMALCGIKLMAHRIFDFFTAYVQL